MSFCSRGSYISNGSLEVFCRGIGVHFKGFGAYLHYHTSWHKFPFFRPRVVSVTLFGREYNKYLWSI